jgi:hypothetical protein
MGNSQRQDGQGGEVHADKPLEAQGVIGGSPIALRRRGNRGPLWRQTGARLGSDQEGVEDEAGALVTGG